MTLSMASFAAYAAVYVLGGLTFVPLVLGLLVLHAYIALPQPSLPSQPREEQRDNRDNRDNRDSRDNRDKRSDSVLQRNDKRSDALRHPNDDLKTGSDQLKTDTDLLSGSFQRHEADVAGYFAVCREYVPGGVNGKPPERTTPAGEVVAAGSPSVYQSMYRSIFDRKQPPTIDPGGSRKARNVFFVVLRYTLHYLTLTLPYTTLLTLLYYTTLHC
jgi:hypothetical protein